MINDNNIIGGQNQTFIWYIVLFLDAIQGYYIEQFEVDFSTMVLYIFSVYIIVYIITFERH